MGCPKIVPKGNLSEMVSNWQISIGYEDNQIMTTICTPIVESTSGGEAHDRPSHSECRVGLIAVVVVSASDGVFHHVGPSRSQVQCGM